MPLFLYESAHTRDGHSFPTRRSSDLGDGRIVPPLLSDPVLQDGHEGVLLLRRHLVRVGVAHEHDPDAQGVTGLAVPADRKRTRLNSSHVATSYAVSCLKQKNI